MPSAIKMRLKDEEYSALNDIFGLPPAVHMMVMTADDEENGDYTLSGSRADFRALRNTIWDELEEGIAPKKNCPALTRILKRIPLA